eukprot:65029_1
MNLFTTHLLVIHFLFCNGQINNKSSQSTASHGIFVSDTKPTTTDMIFDTTYYDESPWYGKQTGILWIITITFGSTIFCYLLLNVIKHIHTVIHRKRDKDSKCKDHLQYNTAESHAPRITNGSQSKESGEKTHGSECTMTDSNFTDLYDPGPIISPTDDGEFERNAYEYLQRKISEYKQPISEGTDLDDVVSNTTKSTNLPRPPPRRNTITIAIDDGIMRNEVNHSFSVAIHHDINTHSYSHDMALTLSHNNV